MIRRATCKQLPLNYHLHVRHFLFCSSRWIFGVHSCQTRQIAWLHLKSLRHSFARAGVVSHAVREFQMNINNELQNKFCSFFDQIIVNCTGRYTSLKASKRKPRWKWLLMKYFVFSLRLWLALTLKSARRRKRRLKSCACASRNERHAARNRCAFDRNGKKKEWRGKERKGREEKRKKNKKGWAWFGISFEFPLILVSKHRGQRFST